MAHIDIDVYLGTDMLRYHAINSEVAMTDRIFGFHVLLDKDYRIDDAQFIIDAVMMIKGVKSTAVHISTPELWASIERAKADMLEKILSDIGVKNG